MGAVTDGMSIMDYMENGRRDYLLMHYKVVDDLSDERYREIFQKLNDEGILINDCYDDVEWVLKGNEGRKFHVRFDIDENIIWNDRLKHFALMKLDAQKADIHSTSVNIKRIMKELIETDYLDADLIPTYREKIGKFDRSKRMYLSAFGEFLAFIGGENAKVYLDVVSSVPQIHSTKSRDLPCYQSILLFDHIINDFIQRTNIEERARYYPLLIWWKISSVIPLRPSEVYQLPKGCIYEKNGKCYIHIERVKNKYKRKQYSTPVIKDFEIKKGIYSIISDYIDYTDEISDADETGYLFSIKVLKETAGLKSKDEDVERITHITMQTIYNHFKKEIIEQEYGYHIVSLGQRMNDNDIEAIKMGDVRHLAIINLMMMGYNPLYIMELAGHRKLDTQMGYYNHVDTFATAKSHVLKEMMKKAEMNLDFKEYNSGDYVFQKNLLGASYYDLPLVFNGKGRCRSENFPYDCVYTECIFCPHFIPDRNLNKDFFDVIKEENQKDLEALQMELKLLVGDYTDNRKFEKIGKQIGVTLNKKNIDQCLSALTGGKRMNGRPQMYTDECLDEKLNEYIRKYPDRTISYPDLEKDTGVPKHIWKYRKADIVRSYNKNKNSKEPEPSGRVMLPSADDVMAKYGDKPELLKTYIGRLLELLAKADSYKNEERTILELEQKYQSKIEELTIKNKQQEKTIKQLNKTLSQMMLDSQYPDRRKAEGIKENVLEFSPKNRKKYRDLLDGFSL